LVFDSAPLLQDPPTADLTKKISPFGILVLHSAAHGSTLRLIRVLIQYAREHPG